MATEIPSDKQSKDIKDIVAGARDGLKEAFDMGSERANQALTRAGSDPDGDVAAATQMALQAIAAEPT